MKISYFDRIEMSGSRREYTDEGFLKAPARTARTGIQQYLAGELGLDGDPSRIVNVFRPEEEVFSQASLDSYNGADLTDDHPDLLVNPKTFREHSVGSVISAGSRDGDFVLVDLIVKDENAIKIVESGKAQLSAGYTAEYSQEDGVTEDGTPYEFTQRDIKINHVALVDTPRAGSMARILDKQMEKPMAKVTLDNGRAIELEDGAAAQVEDSIERLNTKAQAALDDKEALQAQLDSANEKLEQLAAKTTDEAILSRVTALLSVKDAAIKIAGSEFSCDSSDPLEMKRAALAIARPKLDWTDKSEAYVSAAFDQKMEEVEDEEEEDEEKESTDSQKQLAKDMASGVKTKKVVDAKAKFEAGFTEAWKGANK